MIKNPMTKRPIKIGGKTYAKLIESGFIDIDGNLVKGQEKDTGLEQIKQSVLEDDDIQKIKQSIYNDIESGDLEIPDGDDHIQQWVESEIQKRLKD